ncbi:MULTISPECIES: cupin domain-containing protein [Vibrio]|uniref:cupin domain-containing protein n=1 Tax=Vibrio TaxID=662 RepID=UPI002074AF71|nr:MULTISPECIES: cupin domain-containing protein [Vibrio]
MPSEVKYLVDKFNLKPHPEGGYFSENYRSEEILDCPPERFSGKHVYKTSIYYLLEKENVSMFHRLKQDELWHHYTGCSVILHILDPNKGYQKLDLGCSLSHSDAAYQALVPKNVWFAAELKDKSKFSLVGCTTSPGFEFSDWELANKEELMNYFPEKIELISRIMGQA